MQKNHRKYPVVLLFLLVVGIVGFKDVGIFVNKFNTNVSGVELNYVSNDRVKVLNENEDNYEVIDGNYKFFVPKSDLLKVHNGVKGYTVIKNTPVINEGSQSVVRLLFIDEYLEFVEDRGNQALVKTNKDGLVGLVNKSDLREEKIRNVVEGFMLKDYTATGENGQKLALKKGDKVDVAWFEKDYFIIFDQNQNKYNINEELIDLYPEKEAEVVEKPAEPKVVAASPVAGDLVSRSKDHLGRPYVWGDTGKSGFDCSGLIFSVYKEIAGITLPRTSSQMASAGRNVSADKLVEGDLLFFNSGGNSGISHVAMYIGNGQMIHASNNQNSVVIDPIDGYYFQNNFVNAQRILD